MSKIRFSCIVFKSAADKQQRKYLEWLGQTLHLKEEKWYKIKTEDMQTTGGGGLLEHYNGSISSTLNSVVSTGDWLKVIVAV